MKILLAPDSFKESMTSKEACIAMEKGIKKVTKDVEILNIPMADGGEGTMESLVDATKGDIYERMVTAPLGNKVTGKVGILGDKKTAVIEVAEGCGLHLVPVNERNPLKTTSYGVGELISSVLDKDINKLIIGLGGSSTNDGGVGMLQALGASFKDDNNEEIGFGGEELQKIKTIDFSKFDKRILDIEIEVACDVNNPLLGSNGATYVFSTQKGATKESIDILESAMENYADKAEKFLNKDIRNIEGSGAAGGLGAALVGFCNGKLKRGVNLVLEYSGFKEKVIGCDYVFTGEGSIDFQTKFGKTPVGVSRIAKENNVKVIVFAGKIGEGIEELYEEGVTSVVSIMPGVMTLEDALKYGKENLESTAERIFRLII